MFLKHLTGVIILDNVLTVSCRMTALKGRHVEKA